jgi:tetratricopeptide (TPR) repeat protein
VCARCDEHRLANPARYCSSECQRQDWPQHKRRHREQSSILSNRVGVGEDSMAQHEQAVAGLQAQVAEELRADGGTAAVLVAKAAQRMAEQDFRGASARLRKAIQLEPDETANYVNLAVCYAHSNDGQSASDTYLKALARARPDTEEWAVIVARTFNTLSQPYCAKVAKPTWWNDAELKTLSARVLAAVDVLPAMNTYGQLDFTSPLCFAIKMRAYVLCGAPGFEWRAEIRSPEELLEAASLYKRAVDLTPGQEDKVQCLRNATNLTRQADGLLSATKKITMMLQAFGACGALCLVVCLCVIVSGVKIGQSIG